MTRNERQLRAVEEKMAEYSSKSTAVWKKADEEDRETTDEERLEVEGHLKTLETLKEQKSELEAAIKVEDEVRDFGRKIGPAEPISDALREVKAVDRPRSIGQIFVESEQFKSIKEQGGRFTASVEIDTKGTLLGGTMAPGSGTGGGLIPVPDVVPGVVQKLFQPLSVADIIPSGSISTNSLRYVVEGTATSGAAGVAEAAAKPESTFALSTLDEPVKKLATTVVVSDEMMEDGMAVESYLNGRLSLFIRIKEEDSLVKGAGTNDLVGITGRSGVNTYARGTVDNNAVALFKAINGTRGSAFLEPDYIVMHPDNWQTTRLLMDSNNQFYGGGPFQGQYGAGQLAQDSGQISGANDYIWGKPVIVTTAAPGSGTALLGCFQAASQVFRRSGLTVEATNAHSDYFTKNLVAIRAELRLALAVYRPSAFTLVTGLA